MDLSPILMALSQGSRALFDLFTVGTECILLKKRTGRRILTNVLYAYAEILTLFLSLHCEIMSNYNSS